MARTPCNAAADHQGATDPRLKTPGLHNSQSEKKSVFCICCIWVRFNLATNENKASWNCARLIFRKFRSPEETTELSSEHQSSTKSKSSPVLMLQQIHNGLTQVLRPY